jgi:hypothetical protein
LIIDDDSHAEAGFEIISAAQPDFAVRRPCVCRIERPALKIFVSCHWDGGLYTCWSSVAVAGQKPNPKISEEQDKHENKNRSRCNSRTGARAACPIDDRVQVEFALCREAAQAGRAM